MKSVNTVTILNILSTLVLQGITFFASPIISRLLGPENYGIASVYVTWVALFSSVFGLQTQSTIAVARNEFSDGEQKKYQSSILVLSILSYILFSSVMLLFSFQLSKIIGMAKQLIFLALVQGLGQFVVTFVNIKFTYEFKALSNFILTICIAVSTLILSLVLINRLPFETNYMGRVFGQMIPYTLIGLALCFYILLSGKTLYQKKYWMFCLPLCIPIIFHNVSNLILNQSDRVMLKAIAGNYDAGIYSLAYSFGSVLSTLWTALNNSWVPFYYEYSRNKQTGLIKAKSRNYLELFTILAIGFVLVYTEVYHVFASAEYWSGTQLIAIFSSGFYFMFLYSFPVNFEFFHKKTRLIAIGTIIAAICNIILNYFLIRKFGTLGAAIATALSYALQFLFHYICANHLSKKLQVEYPFVIKMFIPHMAIFFVFIFVGFFLTDYPIVRWSMGIAIGMIELWRICRRKTIF